MTEVIAGLDRSDPTRPIARELNVDALGRIQVVGVLGGGTSSAIDGSGAITAGGTAQQLFAGAVPASGYAVYNPDPSNDLWINDSGGAATPGAAGSIRVAANGGGYETPAGMRPATAVSIIGAVTGQKFTARRW